jgi:hypothetical protein
MRKKSFHSLLFRKTIEPGDKDYWQKYYAEALYRLRDLEERNCSCLKCRQDREKLEDFVKTKKEILKK